MKTGDRRQVGALVQAHERLPVAAERHRLGRAVQARARPLEPVDLQAAALPARHGQPLGVVAAPTAGRSGRCPRASRESPAPVIDGQLDLRADALGDLGHQRGRAGRDDEHAGDRHAGARDGRAAAACPAGRAPAARRPGRRPRRPRRRSTTPSGSRSGCHGSLNATWVHAYSVAKPTVPISRPLTAPNSTGRLTNATAPRARRASASSRGRAAATGNVSSNTSGPVIRSIVPRTTRKNDARRSARRRGRSRAGRRRARCRRPAR